MDSLEGHDDALGDFGMGEDLIGELGEDININDFANLFDGPEGEIPAGGASSASGLITDSIFFMIPLCKKPSSGKYFSLPFLPATPSPPSRTLKGLFELTRRPSQALDSPCALLPELQRYKDTVRCAELGAGRSQDTTRNS